jgi:porin
LAAQQAQLPNPSAQHADENGEMLARRQAPATLALTYNSDANANVTGGLSQGGAYLQRVGLIADADLGTLLGWRGASAHASLHAIAGNGLSALRVGNLLTVSGIEAEPAVRLFNLWVEQTLTPRTTWRIGQFTAAQEFAISATGSLFINATFGWPASFAADLPSGGPAYPLAAPGVRLAAAMDDRTQLRLAAFAGDPAGPGTADPQRRDLHGLNGFRLKGGPFVIAEIARTAGGADPAWSLILGGWWHADTFNDLRYVGSGQSLANSADPARPLSGNWSAYGVADARLWQASARSIRGFARVSINPGDRNPVDVYADAGLAMTAPFPTRPGDVAGLAIAFARISPRLRGLVHDRGTPMGYEGPAPAHELVVEASYKVQIGKTLYLQPNIQLVQNPAGALIADPLAVDRLPSSAVVVGIRTSFRL